MPCDIKYFGPNTYKCSTYNRKLRVVDEYLEVRKATTAYAFLFYILRIEIIGFEVCI